MILAPRIVAPVVLFSAATACFSTSAPVAAQDTIAPPRVETRQNAEDTELTLNEINTENYPDVVVFATVMKDGKPVTELGAEDFRVSEDEVEQSPLTVEEQLPPLSVVVTVDVSGSMSRRMDATKTAAADFVTQLDDSDAAQLVSFQREIATLTPMTTDKDSVVEAIGGLVARGDTALYDGLMTSLDLVAERRGRKAVVLLSDGVDDDGTGQPLSEATVEEALERAAEINVPVFVIGLGTEMDEAVLQQIADETGGRYLPAPETSQLAGVYHSIGSQLSGQYAIRYTSSLPADGTARRVDLRVAGMLAAKSYTAPGEAASALPQTTGDGDCAIPAAIAQERPELRKVKDRVDRDLIPPGNLSDAQDTAEKAILQHAETNPTNDPECIRASLESTNKLLADKLITPGSRDRLREVAEQDLAEICTAKSRLDDLESCLVLYETFNQDDLITPGQQRDLVEATLEPYTAALLEMNDVDAALVRVKALHDNTSAISPGTMRELTDTLLESE